MDSTTEPVSTLVYLKRELDRSGDFTGQWRSLSDRDKADLRQWAAQEMTLLGIPVKV